MAVQKPERKTHTQPSESKKLMDYQDTVNRGDSKAERTGRLSITTTPEIVKAVDDAAWERRMPKSHLIEEAIRSYLGI